jgi:membrane fusion protein (multidrug efflux system)
MRKIDRRIVIVISVLFILSLGYGIMRFLIAMKEPPPLLIPLEARRFVRVEPVKYGRIHAMVSGPGRLSSASEVDIISEAAGKILPGNVVLKKGAGFNEGDTLFVIYPDEAILALQAHKSRYQNVLAGVLPDLVIDFPEAEDTFREFFNSIRVSRPLPDLPEIRDESLRIFLATHSVLSEYYDIKSEELQLHRRTVTAPFNGTYLEVYMEIGAFANTGTRVARAIRTDGLELEVPLERADAAWVNLGDPVTVHSDNRDLTWKGTVIRKSRYVDENTQSQELFIKVPTSGTNALLPGEYLQATFPVRPIDSVMEIPRNSVFNSNEVFIVRGDRLAKREINIVKLNERTLLFNGLEEGDSVVVQQLINVSEGTLVMMDEEDPGKGGPGADTAIPGSRDEGNRKGTRKKNR